MATEEKQYPKRDFLVNLEKKVQQKWQEEGVFNTDAPTDHSQEKFVATFPYPYMNGRLHAGHSFTLSKSEFACGYQRLKGKRVLYPFGFHCTGMPIKACADKLKKEIEMFGKNFERYVEPEAVEEVAPPSNAKEAKGDPKDPSKSKKGKATAKASKFTYQFQIMKEMGVPTEDIHKFADALHWLYYFPPQVKADMQRMGMSVDWRRSFITTDVNPYYDSFVRWQFNLLKKLNKVKFGERNTIYSVLDGQACMDHDRASGEGVGVQEYTGIKLQVLLDDIHQESQYLVDGVPVGQKLSDPEFRKKLGNRKLYLVAGTLRPETMYGQTNCYVGKKLDYSVFEVSDTEAWVCTERAAKNMAWQKLFKEKGVVVKLMDLKGSDLVGVPLSAPHSPYPKVYTLPMEKVLADKGTGVVTSVPSDSPDDYITMMDLIKKKDYYQIQAHWVEPFMPPKPIIKTPNLGDLAAVKVVTDMKINGQGDQRLPEAKEIVYKEGFYQGVMLVGKYAGKPVQEAKPLMRQDMIDQGNAFPYAEPEGKVVSRSGDECIVALMDQWYMDYGEEIWKADAIKCVEEMNCYGDETKNGLLKSLDWLGQWACTRRFGLGSRLPWDKDWLIESLSDSTIYMAYYTVAHILHEGTIDGSKPSKHNIKAEDMTDDVWSYIMLDGPLPKTSIPKEKLDLMKNEFNYFYPLDLRVTGKDLISNHLSFFVYNHVAIFPHAKWPKGSRANGHLLLNGEKMSKSTGNFMMMSQALDKFGADAFRFALADAGDTMEDANFLEKTADDAILKLYTEQEWIAESLKETSKLRTGEWSWNDKVFAAQIDSVIEQAEKAFEGMLYREAVKIGYYDLQNARNEYRKATTGQGLTILNEKEVFENMHIDLVRRFAEVQALMLVTFTPHWSDYVWTELLGHKTSIIKAVWPKTSPIDKGLIASAEYIRGLGSKIRSAEDAAARKKNKKGKPAEAVADGEKQINLYICSKIPEWQKKSVEFVKSLYNPATKTFADDYKEQLKNLKIDDKRAKGFIAIIKKTVETVGPVALERELLFDEKKVINMNMDFLRRDLATLKITKINVIESSSVAADDQDFKKAEEAVPGEPTYRIF
ncbi:cytosolic leucyl tRNA synthetase [Boothiomyces sp. JEL0838]|nr:cytosolic leucyl tRNA synthetase [Boothiomyces sp. JEL0838]